MAPIIAVTKFKANPHAYMMAYSQATTKTIGRTVAVAYLTERIVALKSTTAATNAMGRDVYKVWVDADSCAFLVKGDPDSPTLYMDGWASRSINAGFMDCSVAVTTDWSRVPGIWNQIPVTCSPISDR